jgi:hypothetical protein
MPTEDPAVPIVCTECETETRVPLSEVADALSRHNEGTHGGKEVAEVDPGLKTVGRPRRRGHRIVRGGLSTGAHDDPFCGQSLFASAPSG